MLKWLKELDTSADAQRAMIVTEAYEKYAMYPQNIKCAMAMRDVLYRVDIRIWPDELMVGELAAPPNSAPVYPEFSYDWLCDELVNAPMDLRKNDRYVIDEKTKQDLLSIQQNWKNKTVSEAIMSSFSEDELKGSHVGKGINLYGLYIYAGVGHVCADYQKLFKSASAGYAARLRKQWLSLIPRNRRICAKTSFTRRNSSYSTELPNISGGMAGLQPRWRLLKRIPYARRSWSGSPPTVSMSRKARPGIFGKPSSCGISPPT
jgi:hypothetical protein